MKRLVPVLLLLVACGGAGPPATPDPHRNGRAEAFQITTISGRVIDCVAFNGAALTCDWGES